VEVKIISEDKKTEWNNFIKDSNGSILQGFEWGEVKSGPDWTPIRVAVFDSDKIIAGAQILVRSLPFKKTVFYSPRGPVLDYSDEELLKVLLGFVSELAKKKNAVFWRIDPPLEEDNVPNIFTKNSFRKVSFNIQPGTTVYLDLTKDVDDLLKSFAEKTRYNIRLSFRKGVVVKDMSSDEGLNIFHELYIPTAKRDKFLIHPKSYYQKVKQQLIDNNLGKILVAFITEKSGVKKPIGSVFLFTFGKKVWYMYGASSAEHRNVMPNHALHFSVMEWAKGNGYEIYDLWGIPANPDPSQPLWGVYRFKKGFNGRRVQYIGTFDYVFSPIFYLIFEKGMNFYKKIRNLFTRGTFRSSV
jgi:lipid II:glycine glycyltransferase (peptidoglycan interpeptide bridge formation enzyme)